MPLRGLDDHRCQPLARSGLALCLCCWTFVSCGSMATCVFIYIYILAGYSEKKCKNFTSQENKVGSAALLLNP